MWIRTLPLAVLVAVVLVPRAGGAVDGVIEISPHDLSAAGYPIVLSQAGSYRLTANLSGFDNDTTAIEITADDVTLDLGGFGILGPGVIGGGLGIDASGAERSVIRDGFVRGVGDAGVAAGANALIENLVVSGCGAEGIAVSPGGMVRGSEAVDNGSFGLVLHAETAYVDNQVRGNAQPGVQGGVSLGGNLCDGAICSSPPRRRFYLTQAAFLPTAIIGGACATGYHFASLWEILDPSELAYDTTLGHTRFDSGSGPPTPAAAPEQINTSAAGWVRTGSNSYSMNTAPGGQVNCNAWNTNSATAYGTIANLPSDWSQTQVGQPPWYTEPFICSASIRVWCVQD